AVTLYARHSEYTNTITLDEAAKEYQATAYQATLSFVLNTGEVLASIGPYKNTNFFLGNYDTGGSASVDVMTRTDTEDSRTVTGGNVFFDIRSKAVLLEVAETVYQSEHNGAPDENGYVTGTISNATKLSYEMYVGGS